MLYDKKCYKCDCREFVLIWDGRNVQLRCKDNNHYNMHVEQKKLFPQLCMCDDIEDRTGLNVVNDVDTNVTNLNTYKLTDTATGSLAVNKKQSSKPISIRKCKNKVIKTKLVSNGEAITTEELIENDYDIIEVKPKNNVEPVVKYVEGFGNIKCY